MTPNPLLEEIYAAREKLLAEAGGDLHQYLAGVRQREAASNRLIQTSTVNADCVSVSETPIANSVVSPR